nr:axoneme-associated protein mst101(1)-like [Setaria viridis]
MGTVAVTEEGVSASAAEAEEAAVTEVGTSAPEVPAEVAATQGPINDLQRREQVAQEDVRRSEAKFEAVVDKACRNREELQATAAEKSRLDAEELGRQREDLDALQKTVERIRRERQKAWQEWDSEAAQKNEAEKMAAELGAKVGRLRAQVQGL